MAKVFLKRMKRIIIFTFLVSLLGHTDAVHPQQRKDPPLQKGMSYVTWEKGDFLSPHSDSSLEDLASTGTKYIAVCPTYYQKRHNSTRIFSTAQTPSDSGVRRVIEKARQLGLRVMLKPHIDILEGRSDGYWRADIGFTSDEDWQKWFAEYDSFITHYALLAESTGVELFCVGTELVFTAQKLQQWKHIIQKVRNLYNGELIYAANWDNYRNIGFWDDLDYVGIDAYFPLTYRPNPSVTEIVRGWEKWKQQIRAWHKGYPKPIIFTEIGYASTTTAPMYPWEGGNHGNADLAVQANCYKAFFETIWGCSWLRGVYWWRWDTSVHAGGKHNRQFTPQNKPALQILEKYFKQNAN
ncbi:MAG: hypothetical protein GF409_03310 [Candidatus Omnitrophica bacterium]|nr:hypothetical protein [Candidatus Omnitrophota bacterium]